ncbi:calcium:proton antiporter [Chryseobacterium sp. PTM-20240506]|uniref:calcium:proton antiporter n=1 Tax=unclassified Chryseobacterium TaxID=2593645 RepID=UPI002358DA10|nr:MULTISPECIES: ionic transporter y4hA [unclassified Chryseobacterium]MDC8106124.1 ionic transporter y4hA [Chryseobacterium sp. B21-037]MDQ1804628.1 ionic transporter y4hA [Chryseobacterium sp. CKR4-1]WBV55346.1 ionic transporter y4hA [Chryseobacterium daecheongense]
MKLKELLHYTFIFPVLAVGYYFSGLMANGVIFEIIAGILLTGSVLSAVHHAEVVAHKVGEPFGTIILALCITIIEVALIISLMIAGGDQAVTLARDTVFAAVMIILNGILGICILVGGVKYYEQFFARTSATTYLVSIVSILALTLILPNFTSSVNGPFYNTAQLIFVSIACLVIYGVFLMVQTVRHRNYFIITSDDPDSHYIPSKIATLISFIFLVICLIIVVLMAKGLSATIENMVQSVGAPKSLVGVIIAAVVLLPEGVAAIRAARNNQIQSSVNLALGSALASIGLTIPAVSIVCIMYDIPFVLGLDRKDIILLSLSVFIVMLSLSRGKTNILYGTVLLVNLAAYIFTVIVP